MLEEIVYTILPITRTLWRRNKPNENQEENNNSFKRKENTDEILRKFNQSMDNAETYTLKKRRYKMPMLISFLVFYICVINVIISCDVSVRDVNSKEQRGLYERPTVREKPKFWWGHKHEAYDSHAKNLRKGRASSKRQTDEDKTNKYGPESQDLSKYYDYYKNKDEAANVTEYAPFYDISKYMHDDSQAVGHPHDLASHPYYLKNIKINLRPERHLFRDKIVKLGVLLPADPNQEFSLVKVLPILELAVPAVTRPDGPLPGWTVLVDYRDTGCSSVEGPLAAFEFYVHESAGKHFYFIYCYIHIMVQKTMLRLKVEVDC